MVRPARRVFRKPRVLPKGAGSIICLTCGAKASADGKGSPISLQHTDDCTEK